MVTSAGETSAITEAKGMMTNAIIGFIILLGAWLIVNTIMVLVVDDDSSLKTSWYKIDCVAATPRVNIAIGTGRGTVVPTIGNTPPTGDTTQYNCAGTNRTNCVSISSTNVPNCIGGVGDRVMDPAFAGKLEGVGTGWCASSGGIEQGHANPCHTTYGNCIDAVCGSSAGRRECTTSEAVTLQKQFRDKGLWPVFELSPGTSQAVVDQYRNAGVCAYVEPSLRPNSAHFSVYVSRSSGTGQFNAAGGCSQL